MQREMKYSSSKAPGGRSKRSWCSVAKPGVAASAEPGPLPLRAGEHLAPLQVHTRGFLPGKKLELQAVLGTFIHTIQAEMTLRLTPGNTADRVVSALAAQQAAIAVITVGLGS